MSSTKKNRLQLCDLPEPILISILSLLPTQSAVATCILSRRWQYLWTSITALKLHQHMFRQRSEFINFVDRAMILRHGSSLVSYSLHCEVLNDVSRVNSWITTAVQCNVKKLSLHLNHRSNYVFPSCVFLCQSLVKLDLSMNHYTLGVPCSIRLSNLKCLRLHRVTFADDESAENLLSSSPLVEELTIHVCKWENCKDVKLSTPNLKYLDIEEDEDGNSDNVDHKICFMGDQLSSFLYTGSLFNEYQICLSSSAEFIRAKIYVHQGFNEETVYANRCYKLINALSKAHDLTLTDLFIQALEYNIDLLDIVSPTFKYLTQLSLEYAEKPIRIDSTVLMKIFEQCPHLERLDIAILSNYFVFPVLNPVPLCFQFHLKCIKIGFCTYHADNDDVINVVLNSSFVLEKLEIKFLSVNNGWYGVFGIEELQKKLDGRPRRSKDCKIVLKHADSFKRMLLPLLV